MKKEQFPFLLFTRYLSKVKSFEYEIEHNPTEVLHNIELLKDELDKNALQKELSKYEVMYIQSEIDALETYAINKIEDNKS